MIKHIIITFIIIAALAYYFDIDVRAWIERSGIPAWFGTNSSEDGGATSTVLATSNNQ